MRGDVDPLHRALVAARRATTQAAGIMQARERLAELLDKQKNKRLLMSNESILDEPFEARQAAFYPHADRVAPILAEVFAGYNVRISFTIRNFTDLLPSYYVQLVRRGGFQSLNAFVASIDTQTLTWEKPVAALQSAFDETNVHVRDYEDLKAEPDQFVKAVFAQPLDIALPEFNPAAFQRNRSFGGAALHATRALNFLTSKLPRERQERYRKTLRRSLIAPMSRAIRGNRPTLPTEYQDRFDKMFQQDRNVLLK